MLRYSITTINYFYSLSNAQWEEYSDEEIVEKLFAPPGDDNLVLMRIGSAFHKAMEIGPTKEISFSDMPESIKEELDEDYSSDEIFELIKLSKDDDERLLSDYNYLFPSKELDKIRAAATSWTDEREHKVVTAVGWDAKIHCHLSGIVDGWNADTVYDFKTRYKPIDEAVVEKYRDEFQWMAYLYTMNAKFFNYVIVDASKYKVLYPAGKPPLHIVNTDDFVIVSLERCEEFDRNFINTVKEFHDFVLRNNLQDRFEREGSEADETIWI